MPRELKQVFITLSDRQKQQLADAFHKRAAVTIQLSTSALMGPDSMLLTPALYTKVMKHRALNKGLRLVLSRNLVANNTKEGGFIGSIGTALANAGKAVAGVVKTAVPVIKTLPGILSKNLPSIVKGIKPTIDFAMPFVHDLNMDMQEERKDRRRRGGNLPPTPGWNMHDVGNGPITYRLPDGTIIRGCRTMRNPDGSPVLMDDGRPLRMCARSGNGMRMPGDFRGGCATCMSGGCAACNGAGMRMPGAGMRMPGSGSASSKKKVR